MPESQQDWQWDDNDMIVPDAPEFHDDVDDYLNGDLDESDLLALSEV